jgi:cob(I)alamin adenosyltransferase
MAKRRTRAKRSHPAWDAGKAEPGLVHLYTGDGKGKTTSALGLILRASGQGLRCCLVQFMKGKYPYGEIKALRKLKTVTVKQFGTLDFVRKGKQQTVDIKEARKALAFVSKALSSGCFDLVILDEVCVAEYMGLISLDEILQAVKNRAPGVETVLTGRKAHKKLLAIADYITRFEKVAHPYDKGTLARKGIEF